MLVRITCLPLYLVKVALFTLKRTRALPHQRRTIHVHKTNHFSLIPFASILSTAFAMPSKTIPPSTSQRLHSLLMQPSFTFYKFRIMPHVAVPAQHYALVITQIGPLRTRAHGILPKANNQY